MSNKADKSIKRRMFLYIIVYMNGQILDFNRIIKSVGIMVKPFLLIVCSSGNHYKNIFFLNEL